MGPANVTISPGQTFRLPIIFNRHVNKRPEKLNTLPFKMTSIFFYFVFLLVRLVRSSYCVIFDILTGQKKDVIVV